MPNTAIFQERVLNAIEAIETALEAGDGAASLTSLQAIETALEAIQAEQAGDTLTSAQALETALEAIQTEQAGDTLTALQAIVTSQASIAASDGQGAFSVTYIFPAKDFGNGDWTEDIQAPTGFRGLVKAISIYDITEAFNGDTTEARVEVGIQGGDVDAYIISSDITEGAGSAVDAGFTPTLTLGAVGTIPSADNLLVTGYAPDDAGANEGIGTVAVTISYFL